MPTLCRRLDFVTEALLNEGDAPAPLALGGVTGFDPLLLVGGLELLRGSVGVTPTAPAGSAMG